MRLWKSKRNGRLRRKCYMLRYDPTSYAGPDISDDDFLLLKDIEVQDDGKALVGHIRAYAPTQFPSNRGLFRLNADGSVDSNFLAPQMEGVTDLEILPDGKILMTGTGFRRLLP